MSRANGRQPDFRDMSNWGISDTELLGIVDDLADENGWTTTYDIRLQLGERVDDPGLTPGRRSGVGGRLGWMRRYGWVERNDDGAWRLTAMGNVILDHPNLTKAFEKTLENLNPAQRLKVIREIAEYSANG